MDKNIQLSKNLPSNGRKRKSKDYEINSSESQPSLDHEKWHCNSKDVIKRIKAIFAEEPANRHAETFDDKVETQKNYNFFRSIADFSDENV